MRGPRPVGVLFVPFHFSVPGVFSFVFSAEGAPLDSLCVSVPTCREEPHFEKDHNNHNNTHTQSDREEEERRGDSRQGAGRT